MNSRQSLLLFFSFSVSLSINAQSSSFPQKLGYFLDSLVRADSFSGSVLIARHGQIIFQKAYGYADRATGAKANLQTAYNLASMNKMFTGMAIMQLNQAGKLDLNDLVGKYLPDFPNKAVRDSVTVHQLLTHTSGMGNFWEEHDKLAKEKYREPADYLPLFATRNLLFKPGTSFTYSNSGFMVLGLLIEKISGEKYNEYVKKHIYIPAGMNNTDAFALDEVNANLATGYTMSLDKPGKWMNNNWTNVIMGTPAGGGYSTTGDLFRFAKMLGKFSLLDSTHTALYTTGKVDYARGRYGYGFSEETINGHKLMGHTGGHFGIANELMIVPDLGYIAVILTNREVEDYWAVSNFIKSTLLGPSPATENYFFTQKVYRAILISGLEAGRTIAENAGKLQVKESVLERMGYRLLFRNQPVKAIELFTLVVERFPKSSMALYNLAEAYRITGDKGKAISYYQQYLELEPDDSEVKKKIQALH